MFCHLNKKKSLFLRININVLNLITIHRLVNLALAGSIGITLIILACALPQYKYVYACTTGNKCFFYTFISFEKFIPFVKFNFMDFSLWWPSFVILLYIFSVIPTLIIKRSMQSALFGPSYIDLSIFLTMGFIISSFGLPIVLERAGVVSID